MKKGVFKFTAAEEKFCQLVAKGDQSIKECLRQVYPKYRKAPDNSVKCQAKRLVSRPPIVERITEIKESLAIKIEDKYAGLKEEMVDRLVNGIRVGTEGDPLTVVEFVPAIKQLSAMLGWDAPKDITVRNGGVSDDYKGPPTLMTMTDEEISEKLKMLRGE